MPPTLVLPPRYTADSNALWKAAITLGWPVARLQSWRVPEELKDREVAIYGEPLFAAHVAETLGLVLADPPEDFLVHLPNSLLHRRIGYVTLSEARRLRAPTFIKPPDEKTFAARVYDSGADLPELDYLPESTLVLTSDPVEWVVEYRCFVLNREVLTYSAYWRGDTTAQAEDGSWPAGGEEVENVLAIAGEVLQQVELPAGVVLDIGLIKGKGWAVVEANPAYGAGIYGCDPAMVLEVIRHAVGPAH